MHYHDSPSTEIHCVFIYVSQCVLKYATFEENDEEVIVHHLPFLPCLEVSRPHSGPEGRMQLFLFSFFFGSNFFLQINSRRVNDQMLTSYKSCQNRPETHFTLGRLVSRLGQGR